MRRIWSARYRRNSTNSVDLLNSLGQVSFFGLAEIEAADLPDSWVKSTIAAAEQLLQHRCRLLALEDVYLGERVDWNREYKRGISIPLSFGPWLDYSDTDSYGDFKYFWELGRFQHLITLAKAYYLTGDKKYADVVARQLDDFVEQCPFLLGANWAMPMEAGVRLLSLSWMTAFLKEYLRENAQACSTIETLVRSHVHYVASNFSAYSSANNHLIGEAAGVFVASICFGKLKGMERHARKTYDILCREITRQFHGDGVTREQTTHYHISCYNCFLLAGILGKNNGLNFPTEYWKTLESAANFICALTNDDGSIPHIGDSDDGRSVLLSETDLNQAQSLLATAAVLFNKSDFRAKAGSFDETSFWLLGKSGRAAFEAMICPDALPAESTTFDEGGYYILQSDTLVRAKLIFDCGPLGMGTIAAHGHADSLSFVLYVHDREFFIDPGTYTFIASDPYRDYFRSTAAHNTIVVDGQSQSEMAGPFLWTEKANSFVEQWVNNGHHDRIVAWHDGYWRFKDPVTHRRTIELDKDQATITIYDYIDAKAIHEISQYFHLAPQCQVQRTKPNYWHITNSEKAIEVITDEKLGCRVVKGSKNPPCGWASSVYDQKVSTHTLVCTCSSKGNQCFTTTINLAC